MMLRTALVPLLLAAPAPAFATEWLYCGAEGIEVGMLLGSADVLSLAAVTMKIGERNWVSNRAYGKGAPISIGQAFGDDREIRVDLVDDNAVGKLASLRLFVAEGAEKVVYGGTLELIGEGAWAIQCAS